MVTTRKGTQLRLPRKYAADALDRMPPEFHCTVDDRVRSQTQIAFDTISADALAWLKADARDYAGGGMGREYLAAMKGDATARALVASAKRAHKILTEQM